MKKKMQLTKKIIFLGFLFVLPFLQNVTFTQEIVPPSLIVDLLHQQKELTGASKPDYLGPMEMLVSSNGNILYVALKDQRRIDFVDLSNKNVVIQAKLPNSPTGMALTKDGSKLYVTLASELRPMGTVVEMNAATGVITRSFPAGHFSRAPVLNKDETKLYVANQFYNNISVFDLSNGVEETKVRVLREPFAAALTPNGEHLLVNNYISQEMANTDTAWSRISIIKTSTQRAEAHIPLAVGGQAAADIVISPDGKYASVTNVLSRYSIPTKNIVGGWINSNGFSVIDIENSKVMNVVLIDDPTHGSANPWAIELSEDGKQIFVSSAGSHEITMVDRTKLHEKLATAGPLDFDLTFAAPIKQRFALDVLGPRSIAVKGNSVYVAGYFSDNIQVLDFSSGVLKKKDMITLGPVTLEPIQRKGEFLFYDASICFQNWQSCTSCHPGSRVDAFNWDNLNDGEGNPKNTKSLLFAHYTPPSMISGVRDSAEIGVRAGIEFALFSEPREEDAIALDEYIKSLRPVPSPYLVDGNLSASAKRGKDLFYGKFNCNSCHPPGLYTDMKFHDVGTVGPLDQRTNWDTPTLIETWRTAPYLHDGRYTTLKQLFWVGKHGIYVPATEQEIDDLVEFNSSL